MAAAQSRRDARALAARPVKHALFLSDLHLHGGDPAAVGRAVSFAARARERGADALFLLGDVFLAWLGPASLRDPGLAPFLDELSACAAAGMRVVLFHGNHDFLLGADVEDALGVEVAGAALDVTLAGRRARLLHGDAFCTRDVSYWRLHRVLRSAAFRRTFLVLPLAARHWVRDVLLHGAGRATAHKSQEEMGMVDAEIADVLRSGPDLIVAGHVHRARDARFEVDGRRGRLVVLADFETTGSHAEFRDGELRLVPRDAEYQAPAGPVVTIDGPAGSGKSSVAAELARRLGFGRLDSGALYRAVTARALAAGLPPGSPGVVALARGLLLEIEADGTVVVDGLPVPNSVLRGPEVSAAVSPVSADPELRAVLLEVQRAAARRFPGLVADGRDMATVVFPQADISFYLDADLPARVERRWRQGGGKETREQVRAGILDRDARDSGRRVAPLSVGPRARVVDTTAMDQAAVVAVLEREVREVLARQGADG